MTSRRRPASPIAPAAGTRRAAEAAEKANSHRNISYRVAQQTTTGRGACSPFHRPTRVGVRGFTLVELLIVISLMAVLAGLVLPKSNATVPDQLRSAAQMLAADMAYARSLAVTNGSRYRVTFDFRRQRYVIEHTGTNPDLEKLPPSPFRDPNDPPDQHIVSMDELPHLAMPVRLEAAGIAGGTIGKTDSVEFDSLGETTAKAYTLLWLSAGEGVTKRYFHLQVNPITGLVTWDEASAFTAAEPPPSLVQP